MVNKNDRRRKETAYTKFHYGRMKLDQKDCVKASYYFTQAIELDDTIDEVYYWRGRAFNESQTWDKALNDLTKAIDMKPNFALAYNERGYSQEKLRLYDESLKDYTKAIELKPNDWGIYENRAYVYKAILDWRSALEDYNQALRLGAKDAETYMYRGVVQAKLGRFDESIKDLTESIRINKSLGTAYFFRAQTYTDMSDYRAASEDYRALLLIKPGHDVAYNNLSFVSNILGNWEESIISATLSMELCEKYKKSSARSFAHRGYAHLKMGNIQQALEDCERSIQLEPEGYPRGFCYRAYVYLHLSRLDDALQDCNKAIETGGPEMADAFYVRGLIYKQQQQCKLANSDFMYCKQNKKNLKVFYYEEITTLEPVMVTYEQETRSVTVDTSVEPDVLAQTVAKEFVGTEALKSTGTFKLKAATDNSVVFSDVSNVEEEVAKSSRLRLVYVSLHTPKKRHSDAFEENNKKYSRSLL